jgi:hypothetical protein
VSGCVGLVGAEEGGSPPSQPALPLLAPSTIAACLAGATTCLIMHAERRVLSAEGPLPCGLSAGLAHLLEHMAFKGTPRIGTRDYRREAPLLEALDETFYGLLAAGGGREAARLQAQLDALQKQVGGCGWMAGCGVGGWVGYAQPGAGLASKQGNSLEASIPSPPAPCFSVCAFVQAADLSIPNAYGALVRPLARIAACSLATSHNHRAACMPQQQQQVAAGHPSAADSAAPCLMSLSLAILVFCPAAGVSRGGRGPERRHQPRRHKVLCQPPRQQAGAVVCSGERAVPGPRVQVKSAVPGPGWGPPRGWQPCLAVCQSAASRRPPLPAEVPGDAHGKLDCP